VNIFFNPVVGRIIDRLGYRFVMIWDTVILFFLCLMFGFAHRIFSHGIAMAAVSVTFVLDWMISNASMAASVYVGRISEDKDEITSTLSTGISINHVVSVAIALLGGIIWESLGVELLFSFAALMAVANTLFAMSIPRAKIIQ
jgi:predicted MFS family arabinose efflux permease